MIQTIQKLQEDYTSANQSLEEAGNDIERLKLYDSMQEGIGLLKNIKDLNTRQNNTKSEIANLEKEVDNKKSELNILLILRNRQFIATLIFWVFVVTFYPRKCYFMFF